MHDAVVESSTALSLQPRISYHISDEFSGLFSNLGIAKQLLRTLSQN
jgi:hypothetical protein